MKYVGIMIVVLTVGCSSGHVQQQARHPGQMGALTSSHQTDPSNTAHGSGLPAPLLRVGDAGVSIPFGLYEQFAVPHVEVMIQGKGPYRFAFDTAMSGIAMIRPKLVEELGLNVVGQAMISDGSGKHNQLADLVQISNMSLGEMQVENVVAVAYQAHAAHIREVPEALSGILGRGLVKDYLLTIDYPRQMITIAHGELDPQSDHVIGFEFFDGVMQVSAKLSGKPYKLIVDTGSRSSITLPLSEAESLPLESELSQTSSVSTFTNTYERSTSVLSGSLELAGFEIENPSIQFADEHTPLLIGYEILKEFAFTVDQIQRLMRFER